LANGALRLSNPHFPECGACWRELVVFSTVPLLEVVHGRYALGERMMRQGHGATIFRNVPGPKSRAAMSRRRVACPYLTVLTPKSSGIVMFQSHASKPDAIKRNRMDA